MTRTIRPAKAPAGGMVKVTVRITFPDGSDAYRSGLTDAHSADRLSFKYARALSASWLYQLKDNEPDPDLASLQDQVLRELNPRSSKAEWRRDEG